MSTNSFCQKYELGEVTLEELKEAVHPKDSTAPAAILFKIGKTYFDLNYALVTEVKVRVKIYKKEGYEFAQKEMGYFSKSKNFRIKFDDAVTYNLVEGKIEKTRLKKKDGQFDRELSENISYKKIILPNVKEGSVIEYSYTSKIPFNIMIPEWYFQYSIPVNYIEYKVCVPQFQTYRQFLKGTIAIDQSKAEVRRSPTGSFKESVIVYSAHNVKALKEEPFVTNMENYRSSIQFELATAGLTRRNFTKIAADWESVAKLIYERDGFGHQLAQKAYFEKSIDVLLQGIDSPKEKIDVIFNFVQSRMTWNNMTGYFTDEGVKKAYEDKLGNVAEINLMLIAMLRYAEIKANPVLVSTVANGIAIHPNFTAYDYVVVAVEQEDNKILLLDATTKKAVPGTLPLRALNWIGRLIREDKTSKEINLMPKEHSKQVVNVIAKIDQNGLISGKTRSQYFDYYALVFRDNYVENLKEAHIQNLEKTFNGIEIENYALMNLADLSKPLVEDFVFRDNKEVEKLAAKIYFSPMLYYADKENPFKEEKREFSIDFPFPQQNKLSFTIEIPEGYEVEYLPKSVVVSLTENIGSFKYLISNLGRQIQLSVAFEINDTSISNAYYGDLKDFYKKMIEKQNEKIILKKIS